MECEKIQVYELNKTVFDPVNVYMYLDINEISAVLRDEGFERGQLQNYATLYGKPVDLSLVKALAKYLEPLLRGVLRIHIRLWLMPAGEYVAGNAHIDVTIVAADVPPIRHVALHDLGRAIIADIFAKHNYQIAYERCEGTFENFDGYVVKIFKPGRR